jgi:hypothetical protein
VCVARLYCHQCWLNARQSVGPEMLEGPVEWGASWDEVTLWLERNLTTPVSRGQRRLLAHEIHRQQSHLPLDVPTVVADFLREYGSGAA